MRSPRAKSTRGLSFGSIYREDGTLVVTVAQEGILRFVGDKGPVNKQINTNDKSKNTQMSAQYIQHQVLRNQLNIKTETNKKNKKKSNL